MKEGFVFVDEVIPGICWDAKYATWDNFTGRPVDGYEVNRIVATRELCECLKKAVAQAYQSGLGFLLWDAYRPQCAVDNFLFWSRQPEDEKTKSRHYPNIDKSQIVKQGYVAEKSGHSRGSAIDLTLYYISTMELLDMGGSFDFMDESSHHGAAGVSKQAEKNRKLLKNLMESAGFCSYENEWWHYVLEKEPYPDTYFEFPIKGKV